VVAELLKGGASDRRVESILGRMNKDGSFKGINYADLSRTAGFPHRIHTDNLAYLARAYRSKTSKFHNDKELLKTIGRSLKYWTDHDFVGDNWHNNQISTPNNLVRLMLLVGDELPKNLVDKAQPMIGRAHMKASGARPSGDRIYIAGILAKNLLFLGDKKRFDEVIRIIEGELKFSTGKRGMQHDYSFHHRGDRVNNTTSYGYGKYANAFGEWSFYVSKTKYAFSEGKIKQLIDYYLDGICKQQVYGIYADISVKNRSISRRSGFHPKGTLEIQRLLHGTDYRKAELEEIIRLRTGKAKPTASFCKFFWQTEHFVCQRPHFYTTVRMFSVRNRNMEQPYNGDGLTTHHRADGANYLMLKGNEYHDIWPVYDWQKISGATILQKPKLHSSRKIQLKGLTSFVGAVTDGHCGAVAFDFKSPHDKTEAMKSWFFFDDEYVCLGAGIKAPSDLPVATTVDQVLLRGGVTIAQGGGTKRIASGERELKDVRWVHHGNVGYLFPSPSTVYLSNQKEQGRWSDLTAQKRASKEVVTKDVFALWFDHGKRPKSASYEYIVVPGITVEQLGKNSRDLRGIKIISNTSSIQAVKNTKLGICQLVFYKPGQANIGDGMSVSVDSRGTAMLQMHGAKVEKLSVSDPSRKLAKITVTVPGTYTAKGKGFHARPEKDRKRTSIVVDLPQGVYAGKSVTVDL